MLVTGGDTNVTTYFMMRLTATGKAATGLTITTFDMQYTRTGATPAAKVDATALAATDTAHTDNYMIEVDATSSPGLYRADWPDAAFAAGVKQAHLSVKYDSTVFSEVLAVDIDAPVYVTSILAAVANKIADHVMRRTAANIRASSDGDAVTFRSGLGLLSKLVNRVAATSTTLTIYEEDDTTSFATQTLTTDASANPITEVNTD